MKRLRGYAYVEVLVAAVILAVAIVPASNALRDVLHASTQTRTQLALYYEAFGAFEVLLTTPYGTLETEATITGGLTASTALSEATTEPNRIVVWSSPHDIDNADGDGDTLTGTDDGVLRVWLTMDGTSVLFETLVTRSG